jgi:hypothetical protein
LNGVAVMEIGIDDFIEPDPEVPHKRRGCALGMTKAELAERLSARVGEDMRLRKDFGAAFGFGLEDVRFYCPANMRRTRSGLFAERPMALAAERLSVHPVHGDFGPPGLTLQAYEEDVLEKAADVRAALQRGRLGLRGTLHVRVLPSSWCWGRMFSPGLFAVGLPEDYPGFFDGD